MDKTVIKRRSAVIKSVSILKELEKEITKTCPDCNSQLTYSMMGINELVLVCVNEHCEFPLNRMSLETVLVRVMDDDMDDTISNATSRSSNIRIDATQRELEMEKFKHELNTLKMLHEDSEMEETATGAIVPESYENLPRNELIEKLGVTIKHRDAISDGPLKTCPDCGWDLETVIVDYGKITFCCTNDECCFPIGYDGLEYDQIFVNLKKEFKPVELKSEMCPELMILYKQQKQVNRSEKSLENDIKELRKIDNKYKNKLHKKYGIESNSKPMIMNKSWLRRLESIQKCSKDKLVTDEEMKLLQRPKENKVILVRVDASDGIPSFTIENVRGDDEVAVPN